MAKKWIQSALKANTKGALHKELHVPIGTKIPSSKLKKAEHSKSPTLKKACEFGRYTWKAQKKIVSLSQILLFSNLGDITMAHKSHAHHKKMAAHHKEKAAHHMAMAKEAKGAGKKEYGSMDKKPLAKVEKRGRGKDKL